jgi:hypothetical protein
LIAFLRKNHDHESPRTYIFDMMAEMLGLLCRASESNEGALKLRQKPVLFSRGIETMDVGFTVQNIDVFSIEAGLQERIDGGASVLCISDRADNTIGWIRNEIPTFCPGRIHRTLRVEHHCD